MEEGLGFPYFQQHQACGELEKLVTLASFLPPQGRKGFQDIYKEVTLSMRRRLYTIYMSTREEDCIAPSG